MAFQTHPDIQTGYLDTQRINFIENDNIAGYMYIENGEWVINPPIGTTGTSSLTLSEVLSNGNSLNAGQSIDASNGEVTTQVLRVGQIEPILPILDKTIGFNANIGIGGTGYIVFENDIVLKNNGSTGVYIDSVPEAITPSGYVLSYDPVTKAVTYVLESGSVGATGSTGATGPTGFIGATGSFIGDYVIWDGSSWVNGGSNINIGESIGKTGQGVYTIAIGTLAGNENQEAGAVSIGNLSGQTSQGYCSVAMGYYAGQSNQGGGAISLGQLAGQTSQGVGAVAMGYYAGQTSQGLGAVAIGPSAGQTSQGSNAIAIGYLAGFTGQKDNTIVLNASGVALNGDGNTGALYIDPIRVDNTTSGYLSYNTGTKEVVYNNSLGATGPNVSIFGLPSNIGNTGSLDYILDCSTSINNYGELTGKLTYINGTFTNVSSKPISLLVDFELDAEQGNWDVGIYKNGSQIWQSQILGTYTRNSFSQSVVMGVGDTGSVRYNISGPATYTLSSVNTKIQFTQLDSATGAKTFVIDHPEDPIDKYLVHACLEGPEAGVYYRGKSIIGESGQVTIELPSYVSKLADELTVHITPIYVKDLKRTKLIEAEEVIENKFVVHGDPGPFNWIVYGRRSVFAIEPYKTQVYISGQGPYRYIQ